MKVEALYIEINTEFDSELDKLFNNEIEIDIDLDANRQCKQYSLF